MTKERENKMTKRERETERDCEQERVITREIERE
jgi:hypothetical protein